MIKFDMFVTGESYENQYRIEMEQAIENCQFIEDMYTIYENNVAAKIRMLNKINRDYGKYSRSIEHFCNIQSMEADENTPPDAGNNDNKKQNQDGDNNNQSGDNNKKSDPNKMNKLKDFLKKVQEAISSLISKIFQWIINLINKFRYNNKVFQNTINAIEKASPEELSKISGDLQNAQIEAKDLIVTANHPQENINKHIGTYQNLSAVYVSAITAGNTNAKDTTKIKDFAAKLKEFVRSVPDVGNACPEVQGDGTETLKQYKDALKSFCSETLNYKKHANSFNSFFGGTETVNGKVNVSKLSGTTDPKAIITLIKTESDATSKLSNILVDINKNNVKAINDMKGIISKVGVNNPEGAEDMRIQIDCLLAMEKTLVQINSIFCGICANNIKTINVIKGKLIDFVKSNVSKKEENNKENTDKKQETPDNVQKEVQQNNQENNNK